MNETLKLGNKSYADLKSCADLPSEEQELVLMRNPNRVYINTNDAEYTDLLQLEYFPNECKVKLGKAKYVDYDTGKMVYIDIYVPTLCYPFCKCDPQDPEDPDAPKRHVFDNSYTFTREFNIQGADTIRLFDNNFNFGREFAIVTEIANYDTLASDL